MALYEVTLRQRFAGQLILNVFSYVTVPGIGVTPSALELLTEMGFIPEGDPLAFPADTIAGNLSLLQSSDVDFLSAEARELYSLTDFYEAVYSPAIAAVGGSGSSLSPFTAYGLRSARVRLDIRRSTKRFVGVSEGWVNNGGVLETAAIDALDAVADSMSELLVGLTAAYSPATISRNRVVDVETGKVTYELYPTEAEQEEHTASGLTWAGYAEVRSQTSRQYGRGS